MMKTGKKKSVLVIFGEKFSRAWVKAFIKSEYKHKYDVVVSFKKFQMELETVGFKWTDIESFMEPGSIYEASALLEDLSRVKFADGNLLAKSFTYKGYELWWMYCNGLFLYFCLPYTQYKKLLYFLREFQDVHFFEPPYKSLFSCYLEAYGCRTKQIFEPNLKSFSFLSFGIFIQIVVTLLCLPVLIIRKSRLMVFIGDKFEKNKDFDFRMRFIYQELRQRNIQFVEFIRSLESWRVVLRHVFVRRRPVIYSEAIAFAGRFLSLISGGRQKASQKFSLKIFGSDESEERFKFLVAAQPLLGVYDDIWATRIMKWILHAVGVKAAFIAASLDRNFHTVLGCKLNSIPTVGILHGVSSRYYNMYDFLPQFDSEQSLSVDKYGVWSEWWREYYIKNSKAYRSGQLFVSGPMRPLEKASDNFVGEVDVKTAKTNEPIKVLFVSEQLAVPHEVLPYIEELLKHSDIKVIFTFRHHRDGFKDWLLKYRPQLLKHPNIKIADGGLQDAIANSDVAVGSHSTAVLEMLLSLKSPIFFQTQKWGDYFSLKEYDPQHTFFAENPSELIKKIRNMRDVPRDDLKKLRERYFGDPYKNGSKWVVDQLETVLLKGCVTK